MSTREAMSHAALGWVKPELDQTLLQMRQQIQDYVEQPGDGQQMVQAATWLHQVHGTLQMVELYAPAMVAEELELLAKAVHLGQVSDTEEACAVLMRGTVLLPDYLERLQNGHRDIPIVLLPLLNEIRALRGVEGLNENVLLAFGPQASDISAEELEHARGSLAGRNRDLLATVGGVVKEELLRIKDALDLHLRTSAPSSALQTQVNELAAVADTLAMMGLESARELVLSQHRSLLDVVHSQSNIDEDLLLEIAGALLHVDASLDDQVSTLGSGGRHDEDPAAAETQRTVEILAAEAITNFAQAREHFVAFIETNWDHARLAGVPRLLGDVSGALQILEMDEPAQYVTGVQLYIQNELIGRLRIPSGRQLDTLADAMASLEYFLEGVRERRPGGAEILEISRSSLQALRYWPLPVQGAAAADVDGFAALPAVGLAQGAVLPELPAMPIDTAVPQMAAAASVVPAADDYPYVFAASHQVPEQGRSPFDPVRSEEGLLEQDLVVTTPLLPLELEETADALPASTAPGTAFNSFDPVMAEDAPALQDEVAVIAPFDPRLFVDDLDEPAIGDALPGYSGRGEAVENELRDAGLPVSSYVAPIILDDAVDMAGATVIQPQALEWSAEEAAFFSQLNDSASTLQPVQDDAVLVPAAEVAAVAQNNEAGFQDNGHLVDADAQEIREVFLEEFEEELGNLTQMLPAWAADPGQTALLLPVRRVFHTLKGSGRLVGARTLGEFSWSIESMLNRVRDGLRPASPAVVAMVGLAVDEVLPQLYGALHAGTPVQADLMAIQGVAERIAAGEETYYVPAAGTAAAAVAAQPVQALPEPEMAPLAVADEAVIAEGTPAAVDSVLLDILQAEVTTHLATLRGWLAACELEPQLADEPLLRAVHTMSGAFAMTDVPEITAVTGPAEALVKRLLAAAVVPGVGAIAALSGAATAIAQTLEALQAERPMIPGFQALGEQLQAQVMLLPEAGNPLIGSEERWDAEPLEPLAAATAADDLASPLSPIDEGPLLVDDLSAYLDASLQLPQASEIDALITAAGLELLEPAAALALADAPVALELTDEVSEAAADPVAELLVEEPAAALELGDAPVALELADAVSEAVADPLAVLVVEEPVATLELDDAPVALELTGDVLQAAADPLAELLVEEPAATLELADAPVALELNGEGSESAADPLAELLVEEPAAALELDDAPVALELADEVSEAAADPLAELVVEEPAAALELDDAPVALEPADDVSKAAADPLAELLVEEPAAVLELDDAPVALELADDVSEAAADSLAELLAEEPAATLELADAPVALELADDVSEAVADPLAELLVEEPAAALELDDAPVALELADDVSEAAADPLAELVVEEPSATLESAVADLAAPRVAAPLFELEPAVSELAAGMEPASADSADSEDVADALDFNLLDLELVDIFVEEGKDLLDHCDSLIAQLRDDAQDSEAVAGLQRDLHTLKGGARMAGINPIGDLAHTVESLLEAVAADRLVLGTGEVRLLEGGFDHLHRMVTRTGEHKVVSLPQALVEAFEARIQGMELQVVDADVLTHEQMTGHVGVEQPDVVATDLVAAVQAPEPAVAPWMGFAAEAETEAEAEVEAEAEAEAEVAGMITIAGVLATVEEDLAATSLSRAPVSDPAWQAAPAPAVSAVPNLFAAASPTTLMALEPLSAPVEEEITVGEDGARAGQEQVRVRADLLDRLVGHAGEVAIYRSRLEQQLGAFRGAMAELDRTNARLRDQLRRLDLETEAQIVARYQREDSADRTFDPLELDRFSTLQQLSRALNESAADLSGLQGVLDDLARNYDNLLGQQSRVSSELQDGLMRARMVPFDGLVPRLRRVLRQAAADTGKQVRLVVEGTQGEMDRNVLDRMIAPLEHMLRNSVAHGIEAPAARVAAGKPEEGVITLQLRREGAEIALEVADDGAGLDRAAIRRRAEQRGLLASDAVLSEQELDGLIFASGFTTADQVSQLAGRGVGMDVVRNEVRQLGGSVDIQSTTGRGARFIMRLPQTLAVTQAVFAQIGETTYAVPVASVSGIGRIARERFESGEGVYRYGGEDYALYDLGQLVGQGPAKAEGQAQVPLLLVRAGDLRAAVAIDQVVGNREVVVKPVGMQMASVPGIYGATITGEGNVVVILDVAPLVRRLQAQPSRQAPAVAAVPARQVPLVMVVDDSLTMRKVTGRVLERHNFEVSAARDGIEALEQLEERVPDLMLLDIEMPRMDGYELATAMRADPRYKDVPIIMITSRTGDKHRQRALEIGVQRYLGKPYQEPELMRNVYDLLGISRARE